MPIQDTKAPIREHALADEARLLNSAAPPSLKDLLLAPQPRFENLIPPRRKFRRRAAVEFE
jgi:hypothetical protein